MAHGRFERGHPKVGGRQQGTRNKRTVVRDQVFDRTYAAVMAELPKLPDEFRDLTPLEGLLLCGR